MARKYAHIKQHEEGASYREIGQAYDEFMELIETGGDVSFDITPYLQNRVAIEA